MPIKMDRAKSALTATLPQHHETITAVMYDRDFYRGGKGFIGPSGEKGLGEFGTEANRRNAAALAAIIGGRLQKAFTPDDVLNEAVGRRIDGVLASPPRLNVVVRRTLEDGATPTPEEQARIDTMQRELREWADRVVFGGIAEGEGLTTAAREWVRALCGFGRSSIRLFVPPGRLRARGGTGERANDRVLGADSPAEALRHVHIDVLPPGEAAVVMDSATRYRHGLAAFGKVESLDGDTYGASVESSTLSPTDRTGTGEYAEPDTVLEVLTQGKEEPATYTVPMRGRLFVCELREPHPFIDEGIIQLQDALNTASTELRIVNDDAGFPVRLLLGAMPPGEWKLVDVPASTPGGPIKKTLQFFPQDVKVGPGDMMHVSGQVVPDAEKSASAKRIIPASVSQPRAATFEAASTEGYLKEMDARRASILRRCRQLFVLTTGDAAASGESRIQALQDYLLDAGFLAGLLERGLEAVYEAAWHYACYLAEEAASGRDYDLRPDVVCRVTPPRMTPAELQAVIRLVNEGLWSRARGMSHVGVDDPEQEAEDIARERAAAALAEEEALLGLLEDAPPPEDGDETPPGTPPEADPPEDEEEGGA